MKRSSLFQIIAIVAATLVMVTLQIGSADSAANTAKENVTFNKDIAPIFYKSCVNCHRPGEAAPMSLMTYKESRPWARSIREKVATREMPPWHADPKVSEFANDRRLSQKEIETVLAWVDGGAKEGDAKDLPPAPVFTDGWGIGKPDVVFYMPQEYTVPATGVIDYKYFSVPTNFKKDMWVKGAEIRPGTRSVVHHIIVYIQKGEELQPLIGLAPGEEPMVNPDGVAMRIPAGSRLVFQVHYTPNGVEAKDRSYIGITFAKRLPKKEVILVPAMNAWFTIPPNHPNYPVESSYTFSKAVEIRGIMPHMHLRGKAFQCRLTYPGGASKVLLSVPRFDFNWQNHYVMKSPVLVPKGSRVDCIAHFDNSTQNKFNPDPTKAVRWGDQMWDEMMVGWIMYAVNRY